MLTNNTRKYHLGFRAIWPKAMHVILPPYCAWFMKMFTGARRKKKTGNGLAAGCLLFYRKIYGYFFAMHAPRTQEETTNQTDSYFVILSTETYIFEDKMTMY